jgi:anti-sigma factor RsiW
MRPPVARVSRGRAARLSLAAALLLAVAGVAGYGFFGRSSTVLAAQLTLDHLKCFSFYEASSGPADPVALEARLRQAYGWRLTVPPPSPDGRLKLVGARRCITADGRIAHILYRDGGRPLSLFVLPSTERPADHVEIFGYEARIWSRAGTTYVLVAREPGADVERAAAYLQGVKD